MRRLSHDRASGMRDDQLRGPQLRYNGASFSPAEVTPVEAIPTRRFVRSLPERLIGDKAYDSDPLDEELAELGIEMIAPNRAKRREMTQDGRPLRRYRRRWKLERLMAWLHNFRRLVSRWEVKVEKYLGFVQLGCICILMRQSTFMGWVLGHNHHSHHSHADHCPRCD